MLCAELYGNCMETLPFSLVLQLHNTWHMYWRVEVTTIGMVDAEAAFRVEF